MRVLIIGCGRMGSQIAVEYAAIGHQVTVTSRSLESADARLADALDLFGRYRGSVEEVEAARAALGGAVSRAQLALDEIDVAVECVAEDLQLKADVLAAVATASPTAILTTNTSSIPISAIGAAVGAPERVIGTHYWNPPLLMPAVEVISGAETSQEVKATMLALLAEMEKIPIVVQRDVAGFVWNRLQAALLREAIWLVDNGVARADAIDDAVRFGLAPRAAYSGVFQTVELGGIDVWNALMENVVPTLSSEQHVGDVSPRLAATEEVDLGEIARARDLGLATRLREIAARQPPGD